MRNCIHKRSNYFLLGVCLLWLFAGTAFGQEQKSLSLREAIGLSVNHNRSLKVSKSKVEQAVASLREAKDNRLPDIDVSGQYMRLNRPNVNLKLQQPDTQEPGSGAMDDAPDISQAMFGMATASLPIFSGGRINNGIASAKYLETAATLDAERNRQEVVQNTIAAYYNLYKAQAAVNLVKENLEISRQRVKDFAGMEANGLVARNDLLKVQLQESNLELALLEAENNAAITNFNFDLMLGLEEHTKLLLDTTDLSQLPAASTLAAWETSALNERSDFKAVAKRQEAAHAGVKVAKGAYYPTLALSAGYVGINVPHALTVTNAVNVGAGLSYNIASLYKAGAKIKQAKAEEDQLALDREQLSDAIKSDIHKAYQDYNQRLKQIQVYEKAVEQANENYRITKNKYDNSLATTTDLLDADVARLQANIDYTYAKADAVVAYNKLFESAGISNETYATDDI
ncbi:TolC family protein [Olivibacter sp. SDN3]|uniref:TolC family protein n=1 Tax=Olivibacter sp. SDN3 TaxID=2764720 RepID=UPI00165197EE|nr:TolC family protein [Olivibacter sp. SDN3]QNL51463.1 TolC family protein [Olivibacter sp. SDN3]